MNSNHSGKIVDKIGNRFFFYIKEETIEKEAADYHAKRKETHITYVSSNIHHGQSVSVSIPTWDDPTKLAALFTPSIEQLLPIAAWRGSDTKQILFATRDIHLTMREHYSQMIRQVGRNIFPCIIASENDMHHRGVGSMFTLYLEDGSTRRTKVPPAKYEIYKNLSHMPLCVYSIISPYFAQPTVSGWEDKLMVVNNKITVALSTLQTQSSEHEHYRTMLIYTQEYLQRCLNDKSVHVHDFQKYCQSILPHVIVSMARAAEIQVVSAKPQLEAWKSELEAMGKWTDTYVIIPTVWPVGHDNPRQKLFQQLMAKEHFQTHVIMSEMPRDIDESFDLLGRVVGDRVAARLIFGCETAGARSMVCALSTERDLISDACQDAIEKVFENKENTGTNVMLTASQLRLYAGQATSKEIEKALLHTAALLDVEEKKKNTSDEKSFY
ncbi:unnamed protein product [Adineta ricciae]|uniref:Uncharacterized protein n=1 Tax=Adineta ricciae TaxID=249248 RepID=A0A813UEB1_ADIRI|nr:unnamed protein product [Adineta ricciae]CAF1227543.1 unnamed protein product [Adineta ricciae]